MPYADPQRRLEAMRRYAQTPQGKAAKARSHARYVARRRNQQPLFAQVRQVFVTTLAQEIAHRSKPCKN